jgi:hypothetical protein
MASGQADINQYQRGWDSSLSIWFLEWLKWPLEGSLAAGSHHPAESSASRFRRHRGYCPTGLPQRATSCRSVVLRRAGRPKISPVSILRAGNRLPLAFPLQWLADILSLHRARFDRSHPGGGLFFEAHLGGHLELPLNRRDQTLTWFGFSREEPHALVRSLKVAPSIASCPLDGLCNSIASGTGTIGCRSSAATSTSNPDLPSPVH